MYIEPGPDLEGKRREFIPGRKIFEISKKKNIIKIGFVGIFF